MGWIRPYVPADAPCVIDLHRRCLLDEDAATPETLAFVRRFYEQVLFEHPWVEEDLPSLVYEGPGGAIVGFLGVLPRRMVFGNRRIRVALSTRFMVEPGVRCGSLAAAALIRRYLHGPQDLSLTDVANDTSLRIWRACGGSVVVANSVWWSASSAAAPDADAAPRTGRPIETGELLELLARASRTCALRPAYDEHGLAWLLDHLENARHRGTLRGRVVTDDRGAAQGWYLYYTNPDGFNGIQQLGALGGFARPVLRDLLQDAASTGGGRQTRGRLDLPFTEAVRAEQGQFALGPWTLARSDDPELLLALTSGDSYLTRLDGEF